jgi:predicted Zn-dependent peptidase
MTVSLTTLSNGLRVVSHKMPELKTLSVGVWVDAGSRYESPPENGISHMLEHMAFKGTEKRSARAIAQEIEQVGGYLNAYTSREQTAYYARVLAEDLPLAVTLLGDILQHSTFDHAELERERSVIVQEIGQALDTPEELVFDFLQERAYPDQPLGRTILGTADIVRGIGRDALKSYMAAHYHAPTMVVSAAGAVDHDRLVALVAETFQALPPQSPRALPPARYAGGDMRVEKDLEQVHLTLGLEGVTYDDPDYFAMQVFVGALGGGMSSRLFQEVREVRGLCYSIYAFSSSYADTGLIGLYAGTGAEDLGELVPVMIGETQALAENCSEEEVTRAKAQLKAGLLMSLESCSGRAEQLARHLLVHGRVIPVDEFVRKIDAVDAPAVRRFGARMLRGGRPAVAAIGPLKNLEAPDVIAARLSG